MMNYNAHNPAAKPPVGRMSLRMKAAALAAVGAAWFPLQDLVTGWPLAARVAMAAAVGGLAGVIVSLVAPFFVRRKPGRGCA